MLTLQLNAIYRHKRTGGLYTTLHLGLSKLGEGDWVPCVVYRQHGTDAIFVRDSARFAQNFEQVRQFT